MHDLIERNEVAESPPMWEWRLLNRSQRLSQTGGWEYNPANGQLFWTEEIYRIYEVGHDFDPNDTLQFIRLYGPREAEIMLLAFQKAISLGEPYDLELPYTTPSGQEKWLFIQGRAEWQSGKVHSVYGIISDISERKKLALQLQEAKTAAEEANQAKSRFLATMSHEIRTPLNTILGLGELLSHSPHLIAQDQQRIAVLHRAGETLLALINNILDLSKIEAGQLHLEPMVFSPAELAMQTLAMMQDLAQKKLLDLHLQLDNPLPALVRGDANRLRQIFINLLGNAIKFTSQGSISLRVRKSARNQLLFAVADSGIGIPEECLQTIFNPFTQAENSIARRYGGSGLGLNICCQLVEKMGGEIWVESQPGEGSTFTFTAHLPTVTLLQPSVSQLQAANDGHTAGENSLISPLRILLVDDVADNRMIIQVYLETLPHTVVEAEDGLQALQYFTEQPFDLVLMDVMMPVLDGLTTTRRMRQWENSHARPRAIIVALTANAMKEEMEAAMQAGCDYHYSKPLRRQQLLDLLTSLQQEKQPPASLPPVPPPAEQATQTESIDRAALQQMQRELGSSFKRILNNFLVSIPERLDALQRVGREGDRTLTKLLAHKLKGTAATFCAHRLAQLCAHLEQVAPQPTLAQEQLDLLLDAISQEGECYMQQVLFSLTFESTQT
ncbi:MAG: response regulator [Magnetococcales bacterium]|nr:response regulator [Magnetococcales bacterium]